MTGESAADNGASRTATKPWPRPSAHRLRRSHSKPAPIQRAQRRQESLVVHRGLRDAFGRQNNLIAGPCDRPEDDCARGKNDNVRIKSLP